MEPVAMPRDGRVKRRHSYHTIIIKQKINIAYWFKIKEQNNTKTIALFNIHYCNGEINGEKSFTQSHAIVKLLACTSRNSPRHSHTYINVTYIIKWMMKYDKLIFFFYFYSIIFSYQISFPQYWHTLLEKIYDARKFSSSTLPSWSLVENGDSFVSNIQFHDIIHTFWWYLHIFTSINSVYLFQDDPRWHQTLEFNLYTCSGPPVFPTRHMHIQGHTYQYYSQNQSLQLNI